MKQYTTPEGKKHGLISTLPNSSKTINVDAKIKEEYERKRKEDGKIKKAQYLHKNGSGNYLVKPYCRYAGEPLQMYLFLHGHEYEVPFGLIEEVNNVKEVERSEILDRDGIPTIKDRTPDKTHRFVPTGF